MLKDKRLQIIFEMINQEKEVTISDLCAKLDVSHMTIWRDLDSLAKQGVIRRVRGGAIAVNPGEIDIPDTLKLLDGPQAHLKKKLGNYAAQNLVNDGEFITIEAGTTASSIVPYLDLSNLTILTNGLLTTLCVYQYQPNLTLMCSGGVLIETGAFTGPQVYEFFSKYRTHKAFLGAAGFTPKYGFTDPTPLYTQVKSAMKENADQIIMVLDSSKMGSCSLIQVVSMSEVDILVTDSGISSEYTTALEDQGVEVHIVDVG